MLPYSWFLIVQALKRNTSLKLMKHGVYSFAEKYAPLLLSAHRTSPEYKFEIGEARGT